MLQGDRRGRCSRWAAAADRSATRARASRCPAASATPSSRPTATAAATCSATPTTSRPGCTAGSTSGPGTTDPVRRPHGPRRRPELNHRRRLSDLEADGIVAEVVFPNTIPPFYPEPSLKAQMPGPVTATSSSGGPGSGPTTAGWPTSAPRRPGRRLGIVQIMLHDVAEAVAESRVGGRGRDDRGILLPGAPPGSGLEPLYSRASTRCGGLRGGRPARQPPQRQHGARARRPGHRQGDVHVRGHLVGPPVAVAPHLRRGARAPPRSAVRLHRAGHGLDPRDPRHPRLLLFPDGLDGRVPGGRVGAHRWCPSLSLLPSEYWARQCHVGSSFMRPAEAAMRHAVGVDRIMWGSDYPHKEGATPSARRPSASRSPASTPPR